ncbi:MAG: Hsp20 family protein, partial [Rhodospirillales bacterium]|nr:Hsp20 family protein [Rhodospirillales bacterium]MCW8970865.1 Hsp20 family protein [Rhodospirillales bacterium]
LFRSTIGFDRIQRMLDAAQTIEESTNAYPPYNIEVLEDSAYRITMAVAGFSEDDLDITVKENTLFVSGRQDKPENDVKYLHRGIAGRSFERRFQLADHIRINGARLENGLLHIELLREVPEELKPRKIAISGASSGKAIEGKKAA